MQTRVSKFSHQLPLYNKDPLRITVIEETRFVCLFVCLGSLPRMHINEYLGNKDENGARSYGLDQGLKIWRRLPLPRPWL